VSKVTSHALVAFNAYREVQVTEAVWLATLRLLFEALVPTFAEIAHVGRAFYDSERARQLPGIPQKPLYLVEPQFERFVLDMEDVKSSFFNQRTTNAEVHQAVLRTARYAENISRRQIIRAVEEPEIIPLENFQAEEPESPKTETAKAVRRETGTRSKVRGWARVPTGAETCSWCLMLASRGPVYSHGTAGSKLGFLETLRLSEAGELDPSKHLNQWHTGCDCSLVPVYDLRNWSGKERSELLYDLWLDATKDAYGEEKLRAFRRAIDSGKYDAALGEALRAA